MEEKVNTTETHWIIQKRSWLLHNNESDYSASVNLIIKNLNGIKFGANNTNYQRPQSLVNCYEYVLLKISISCVVLTLAGKQLTGTAGLTFVAGQTS